MTEEENFSALTMQDVQQLQNNPSSDVRINTVRKLAKLYNQDALLQSEQRIVLDIFKLILSDMRLSARKCLAENLKNAKMLPYGIVKSIIMSEAAVCDTFIQESSILPEDVLLSVIADKDEKKQMAVASRALISSRVCEALIEQSSEPVVLTLLGNKKAKISSYAYQRVIEKYPNCENVHKALLARKDLPAVLLEKLVCIVSDPLKKQLLMRRDLSASLVTTIVSKIRRKAILSVGQSGTEDSVRALVIHLDGINKLSAKMILRAACVGDMKFFEYAIAMRAGVPIRNTRILLYDSGDLGFDRLYEEAHLPKQMYPAISLAVQTYQELMNETEYGYRDHFCRRLIERLLILFDSKKIKLDEADSQYLLSLIDKRQHDIFSFD